MPRPQRSQVLQIIEAIRAAQSGNPIVPERGSEVTESNRPDMMEIMRKAIMRRRRMKMLELAPKSPEGELPLHSRGVNPPLLNKGNVSFPDADWRVNSSR